jgi:hypothetical protein
MSHINRRSLLSWLGVSAASSLIPHSAVAEAMSQKRTRLLSIESFRLTDTAQLPHVHAYLQSTFLPLLNRIHDGPKMFLEAIVAPHLPQVLSLTVFSSFEEMLQVRGSISAVPGIRRARTGLESIASSVLGQVQSQLMVTSGESLCVPAGSETLQSSVLELRSYHAPTWHDLPLARIQAVLARNGIHPIVNASTAAAEHMPRFTYLVPFESLAARQDAWARLDADSEWIEMQRESIARYGSAAKVTEKSIYKLAPYSPLA